VEEKEASHGSNGEGLLIENLIIIPGYECGGITGSVKSGYSKEI
jgi:hypothetical protein